MLWDRVDALIDSAPGLQDLRAHGLQLLAARRWRMAGRPLPPALVREELQAAFHTHAAPRVLHEVRAACEGPIVIMKGPVVAARFPDPALRPFVDLDLLVPDARATQEQLLAAGFELSGDPSMYPEGLHHLRPLRSPSYPLEVEVHSRPKWVHGLEPPRIGELLAAAEPDAVGVEGILTLAPSHHALVLAAHLWAHDPLARLLRIVDVALMAGASERQAIDSVARAWGMARLWTSTMAVADALFGDEDRRSRLLRTWSRGLRRAREPTVSELHRSRLMAPLFIYAPAGAARALAAALGGFLLPQPGESLRSKLERTGEQLRRPSMRRSEHVRRIEEGIKQGGPAEAEERWSGRRSRR